MTFRTRALALACFVLGAGLPVALGAPPSPAGVHGAFRAVRRTNQLAPTVHNRPLAGYRGPRLELRATSVGADAIEPTLGVTRDGTPFFAAAARGTGSSRMQVLTSPDRGRTWSVARASVPPHSLLMDPYLYVDPDTSRIFAVDVSANCSIVAHSDDKGRTWRETAVCGAPLTDQPTLVAGPPPAGMAKPVGYPNYVYFCFNQAVNAICLRSMDGGLSFGPSGTAVLSGLDLIGDEPACGVPHGHIVTDRAGRLFFPSANCFEPWLAISEDAGLTWRRSRVSDIRSYFKVTSVATDTAGNLYYVWWDEEHRLAYLSASRDHGTTWERPLLVTPPGVREVNAPAVAAGAPGRIAVTFAGTTSTNRADPMRPWNYYVLTSTDALAAAPTFVWAMANVPADPVHRGDCRDGRCGAMMDYLDVDIAPTGAIWATLVDTCTAIRKCNTTRPESDPAVASRAVAIVQLSGPGLPGRR